jgi:hypothetical protein
MVAAMSAATPAPRGYAEIFLPMPRWLLDVGAADFKLKALVDFVVLELAEFGVEAIDFGSKVGLDGVDLCVELVDAAIKTRFDCGKTLRRREASRGTIESDARDWHVIGNTTGMWRWNLLLWRRMGECWSCSDAEAVREKLRCDILYLYDRDAGGGDPENSKAAGGRAG